jgi:HlyD family secretion protein
MKRRVVVAVICFIATLVLVFLLYPRPPLVEVAKVRRGNLRVELFTTGVVESELVDVAPRIMAPIDRLFAQEGQIVSAGQVLVVLDRNELIAQVAEAKAALKASQRQYEQAVEMVRVTASQTSAAVARALAGLKAARSRLIDLQKGARPQEIEQAKAAVKQAEAEAERARADLKRAESLFLQGAISARDLETARASAEVASAQLQAAEEQLALVQAGARPEGISIARADVQAAEAALAEAKAGEKTIVVRQKEAEAARAQVARAKAAVEAAEAQLRFAVIRSPFTGVVARKHLEEGEVAGPQNPVYTIAKFGPVWVTAEVDEEDVAAIHIGRKVVITTSAFPGQRAIGRVVRISPIAEPKTVGLARAKVVRARIKVESSSFRMRPGMEVDITGQTVVARNVVLVPNNSIVRLGNRSKVYVVKANKVYPRYIKTGYSSFEFTEVKDGLEPGEMVVVARTTEFRPGQRG